MTGIAFQAVLFTLICWTMVREMRRHPESGFFRPVLLGFAPRVLVLFGAVDAAGALWTARALRSQPGARTG